MAGESEPANLFSYNTTDGILGGSGAYAGIHVPWKDTNKNNIRDNGEYAIFNISGEGKIIAKAGDAGAGGNGGYNNLDWGAGRRRWCRRWNRWKWRKRSRLPWIWNSEFQERMVSLVEI